MNTFFTIIVVIVALVLLNKARKKTKEIESKNHLNSIVNKCKKEMVQKHNCNEENLEVYRDVWDRTALIIDSTRGKIGAVFNNKRNFKIVEGYNILESSINSHNSDPETGGIGIDIITEEFGVMHLTTYGKRRKGNEDEYDLAYAKSTKLWELLLYVEGYSEDNSPPNSTSSMTDGLRELTDMYNSGSLSEDEFTKAKARILG
ncbi:SHOCT domain-containing protein [Priestia megaterium]